jgi:flagellar basal-body rod modification protein FlgD
MAVTDVNNNTSADALAQVGGAQSAQAIQDQFLKMLVTQLTNQDPLNPMDNSQLTSQLAQISTVSSLQTLNDTVKNTLSSIQSQIATGQSLDSTALIGKNVLIAGTRVLVGTDPTDATKHVATPLGIDFSAPAADSKVTITDSSGKVVRTIDTGAQPLGVTSVNWDGLMDDGSAAPDGAYTAAVTATDSAGTALTSATMLTYGQVNSVAYAADGIHLDLGTAGQAGIGDIAKVF